MCTGPRAIRKYGDPVYSWTIMRPPASRGWERLFWSVFEQSTNPMALVTESRRFAEVNPSIERLLGYPRDELVGRAVADLLPDSEHPILESEWQRFLATGSFAGERDLVREDGLNVSFEFAAHTEQVTGRRLVLFVVVHAEVETPVEKLDAANLGSQLLTPREREIVEQIARGESGEEIAVRLGLSPETVRTHVHNAKEKLEARNRAQLVAIALAQGLIHDGTDEPGY
jgi:PAS domain S-box-containing protein